MALTAGTRLGAYEVLAPLGAGGMGEVYRARDTRLNREVALKVLPEALAHDADYMARFQREAQVLASLNHPNIAAIYGIEQNAIVMELVPGTTLEQRLANGRLPLEETVIMARQIAEALEAAHEKGIIHRDLKPANVKVTPEGVVKVLDFGLAKSMEPTAPASGNLSPTLTIRSTQAGVIMGTAAYMSPEQASGKAVDKRADVWSFGVVLYEMLTGEHLFGGETVSHTLADVLRSPIDLGRLPAGTPPAISHLLERCLDRQVRDRLRDIGEARIALQRALAQPASPAPAAVLVRPARIPWILAALATLAAVALGFVAFRHIREEAPTAVRLNLPLSSKDIPITGFGAPNIALSHDAKHVAYFVTTDGHQGLWVRDLDSSTSRLLTSTEEGGAPFWSPDSRFIGYSERRTLRKVPLSGGPSAVICECNGSFGASWGRADTILFAPSGNGIQRVSSAGGIPSPVTRLDRSRGEDSHRYPWFLPDGRHFLYTARLGDRVRSAVYVGELDSDKHQPVIASATNAAFAAPGYILYAQNRTLMAQPFDPERLRTKGEAVPLAQGLSYYSNSALAGFSASQAGTLLYSSSDVRTAQLTWFDRTGKVTGTISAPGDMEFVSLSPDGKTLVFTRNDVQSGNPDLWLHDLERNTDSRFTFSGASRFPLWSADGRTIFYAGANGGNRKLYQKAANGTGTESELHQEGFIPSAASRDGRHLVLTTSSQTANTGNDIWVLPLTGDRKALPYIATEFAEFFASLSPDGRWLAYMSDESKRSEIYVTGFPERTGKWQVSTDGGSRTAWSHDGRELYFISSGGNMMAAEVTPGPEFKAGVPKPLFPVRLAQGNTNFVVSKDGRFLVPSLVDQSSQALNVVLNWPALLQR